MNNDQVTLTTATVPQQLARNRHGVSLAPVQ
jgi:hypothetical protein